MKKTVIIYGSTTGNAAKAAETIAEKLGGGDVKEVSSAKKSVMLITTTLSSVRLLGATVNCKTIGSVLFPKLNLPTSAAKLWLYLALATNFLTQTHT